MNSKFFAKEGTAHLFLFILLLGTFITFSPCLNNDFTNWDDPQYLWENNLIQGSSFDNLGKIFTSNISGKYHPLTLLSFCLEYHFFRFEPRIYHLDNILLHLLNVILVFFFLRKLTKQEEIIFIATALFALHPLQVEDVAWASSRKDLLYAFFFLLSLLCYIKFIQKNQGRAHYYYLSLALFSLSLLSKAMAVSLPLILIWIDYYFKRKINWKVILEKIPFLATAFYLGLITFTAVRSTQAFPTTQMFSFTDRICFSSFALLTYGLKFLWPPPISCYYPLPVHYGGALEITALLSPLLIILLVILILKIRKIDRAVLLLLIFFLIMIFPVLHTMEVNDSIIYDRFVYLPSIAIFFLLGHWWRRLMSSIGPSVRWLLRAILFSYIFVLSTSSWGHCFVWRNSITLWTDVINKFPNAAVAYANRGSLYLEINQDKLAIKDFERDIQLAPIDSHSYLNRAIIYSRANRTKEALADYSKLIELNPSYADAYFQRGNLYAQEKEYDLAIRDYTQVLNLNSYDTRALTNRGNMYFMKGDVSVSLRDYTRALNIDKDCLNAYLNRGMVYYSEQDFDSAKADFYKALRLEPFNLAARLKINEIFSLKRSP